MTRSVIIVLIRRTRKNDFWGDAIFFPTHPLLKIHSYKSTVFTNDDVDMNFRDFKNTNEENALYLANLTGEEPMISILIIKGAKKGCLSLPKPPLRDTTYIEFFVP